MGTCLVTRLAGKHTWYPVCLLIVCMACISVPRLWGLGHPSCTYDELWDYFSSMEFAHRVWYYCHDTGSTGPRTLFAPISEGYLNGQLPYFTVLPFYMVFGRGEISARVHSVVVSLLSIFLVFLIVRRLHGYRFGLLAVVLLGFCPFFLSASRLAFTHGHIHCTWSLLAGLYLLARLREALATGAEPRVQRWLAGGVGLCMGVAAGTDLLAGLWALGVFLVLCVWILQSRPHGILGCFAFFAAGCLLGVLVASPMYATGFPGWIGDVRGRIRSTDGQSGFLWLGNVVEQLPLYYYALVLATKLTPVILTWLIVTIVWHVRRSPGRSPFCGALLFLLWPAIYLSLKPWKHPYYLTPFVPVLYILMVDGLQRLWMSTLQKRYYMGYCVVFLAVVSQLHAVIRRHPDYLMQGIQYSEKLYGEFTGPAVSHGQWVGEALRYIKEDCRGKRPIVYTVTNVAREQIHHYSWKHGVSTLPGQIPPVRLGPKAAAQYRVYILMTRDAKEMVCPGHENAIRENRSLVSFTENAGEYDLVKTYSSSRFPMVWVYRSRAS